MTSLDLIRFRRDRKWSRRVCAKEIGCSISAIISWEKGPDNGGTAIPQSIALAVAARAFQLKPFGER